MASDDEIVQFGFITTRVINFVAVKITINGIYRFYMDVFGSKSPKLIKIHLIKNENRYIFHRITFLLS